MKKKLFFLLSLVMMICTMGSHVAYAEEANGKLDEEIIIEVLDFETFKKRFDSSNENITIIYMSDYIGFSIEFDATSNAIYALFGIDSPDGIAQEIGVKNLYVHRKETGTSIYTSQACSNLVDYNVYYYDPTVRITNPQSGFSYRFKGTVYAICNGKTYSQNFTTDWYDFY